MSLDTRLRLRKRVVPGRGRQQPQTVPCFKASLAKSDDTPCKQKVAVSAPRVIEVNTYWVVDVEF